MKKIKCKLQILLVNYSNQSILISLLFLRLSSFYSARIIFIRKNMVSYYHTNYQNIIISMTILHSILRHVAHFVTL